MKFIVNGALGRMGKHVISFLEEQGEQVFAKVDVNYSDNSGYKSIFDVKGKADCIIDFSFHTGVTELMKYAIETKTAIVIATTGHSEEEKQEIYNASKVIPVFYTGNYSVGIALLQDLVRTTIKVMDNAEVEIIEYHHDKKIDAPSGTALMLYDTIKEEREKAKARIGRNGHCLREENEIGISSIRLGNIVGIHEVLISDGTQTITLKHEAHDRALFAKGAIKAGQTIANLPKGLYDMKSILKA